MRRALVTAIMVASCLAAALPVGAATTPKYLWATINVCDTRLHPNMMGVRASMPGDAQHTKMWMRFVAQYYDRSKRLWSEVKGGVSKWIYVGSGDYARAQSGYTFGFDKPGPGKTWVMRGAVDFKWTKGRRITRTAHVITSGGHPGTKGADPKNYSAVLCEIS